MTVVVAVPVPVFVCVPDILGEAVSEGDTDVEEVSDADAVSEGDSDGVGVVLGNTISYTKLYLQVGISFVNMACS